ncbi:MAG: hypothetical protein QOD30_940, partial [Actinomycetota bacterium]|nr:hypothetical protein [Actinomycetota bacterium]
MNGATESTIATNGIELQVYEAGPKGNPV